MYAEEEIGGNEIPLHLNEHFMKNGHTKRNICEKFE